MTTPVELGTRSMPAAREVPMPEDEFLELPCRLSAELTIPGFTIRDLLSLRRDAVLDAKWANSADIPVSINGQLTGWAEFEVIADRVAIRVTELA